MSFEEKSIKQMDTWIYFSLDCLGVLNNFFFNLAV